MYWLLGILIIIVMIAALAVAGSTVLPINSPLIDLAHLSHLPYLLLISVILAFFIQHKRAQHPSVALYKAAKLSGQNYSTAFRIAIGTLRYSIITLLASLLIIFSGLQALSAHQRAEDAKVSQSMRVQALVTIEGISDSVYDPAINSGYRQVATISHIAPLVAELSAKNLNLESIEQALTNSESYNNHTIDNSLSKNIENSNYRVLLSAYPNESTDDTNLKAVNGLRPGDQLVMTMSLAALATSQQALDNPTGFDSYRWLRGRHIDGVANILAVGEPIGNITDGSNRSLTLSAMTATPPYFERLRLGIDQGRWQLRQHFYSDWGSLTIAQQQAKAVTLSLLTGDRSLINRDTKDLYQLAGISHLLAISGTHVLFLAIMLAGTAVLIFNRWYSALYSYLPRWQLRWVVMISAAFIYALFTGFDVPAARTAWMLLAIGAVRLTLLPISTMRVLLALAVLMAWFDPLVLWQAGYWLSFVAVALILKYDDSLKTKSQTPITNRSNINPQDYNISYAVSAKIWLLCKRLFKLQCWLFIALLPITLLMFGKASLWGLFINLFAIGLFGWVIVPLNLLAGLCYLIFPSVADSLWAIVSALVDNLHQLITWLTTLPALKNAWLYTPVNSGMLIIVLLILLPWLLPRGLVSRWLALPPITLLMMSVYSNQQTLSLTPTIYILPTNDRYVSAAVLQYPINSADSSSNNEQHNKRNNKALNRVSWLFLADHRPRGEDTRASSLTADKLSATLEQQLRTLAVKDLEGVVVQTSMTSHLSLSEDKTKGAGFNQTIDQQSSEFVTDLLSTTAIQLSQNLPTKHYWQAGRSEHLAADTTNSMSKNQSENKATISAQRCELGKTWQLPNGELTLQALTGWSSIDDASVWDCSVAIDSAAQIKVLQYKGANPLRSPALPIQLPATALKTVDEGSTTESAASVQSRLVLDAATHKRLWQLWSLLCNNESFLAQTTNTVWLSHSTSTVAAEVLQIQQVTQVMTYDNKSLDASFAMTADSDADAR